MAALFLFTIDDLLLREAGEIDALGDVIFYPMRIPPGLGIDLDAIELHGEVDVIASGHSGHAAESHRVATFYGIAFFHIDLA